MHIYFFNKYFYRKDKSKLCFGDRVAVLNNFFYQTGGSSGYIVSEQKKKV
jgi:hypothetical protein